MAVRRPVVRVNGRYRQLPSGDTLPSSILGYPLMRGDEVAALPDPRTVPRQLRVLTINSRVYWSDGTTWVDMTATGGRAEEFARLEAETYLLIAARSSHPTVSRAVIINTLVGALKSGGVWSKLGLMYVLAAADEQAARLNWKSPGVIGTLTAVNSPSFSADRGFSGDGVAAYLSTGVSIVSIPGLTQSTGSVSTWLLNDPAAGTASITMATSTTLAGRVYLSHKSTASKLQVILSGSTSVSPADGSGAGPGLLTANRDDASNVSLYKSGSIVGTFSAPSEVPSSSLLTILRSSSQYGAGQIAFAAAGATLSAAETAVLHSALYAYLQAIGATA